ncbi:MAG TPA: glycogen/starch synthase [Spirochaetia bacterium]|nr:glycogen/starch synthase [Spirochaetia bacterium]
MPVTDPRSATIAATPSFANLLGSGVTDESGDLETLIRGEITRAFNDKRGFTFFPDRNALEQLATETDGLSERFRRMKDVIMERTAGGDQTDEQRLKNDTRLSSRITNALQLLHAAIARTGKPQLAERRFVFIREAHGAAGLNPEPVAKPVIARVGKGPQWEEVPTIYLSLQVFDAMSTEQPENDVQLFDAFVRLLLIEERAIETGYAHTEEPTDDERVNLDRLIDAVSRVVAPAEVEYEDAARPSRARPFSARYRQNFLDMLNARRPASPDEFDFAENKKAIDQLQKLARKYKRAGDRKSLREVVRLLVAASGHDIHEIRDSAALLLERVFAPKDFDAPLASNFQTVRQGANVHFTFQLAAGRQSYLLRIFHAKPQNGLVVEADIDSVDIPLRLDRKTGLFTADRVFNEGGHFDYLVFRKSERSFQWVSQRRCSGRVNVISDVSGEIALEIFPDIHGHTRMYWRDPDGHPGMVYNENGEIIRLGRFSDVTAHLEDLKARYRITAIYLLGVQQRGSNREDWAPEATSPSPFAPMSLTTLEPKLGGNAEFRELVAKAHECSVKVIVDIVPHLNRKATEIPDDWRVRCYDDEGHLVTRASTDGKFGSWNDGALLNYRKLEVWEWLAESVVKLIKEFDVDGIRFDSAHAVPIMMKRNNYPFRYGEARTAEEMVEGGIIVNDREDDHLITTGYYDSACRDTIANPFQTFLVGAIGQTLDEVGKKFFVYLAECYWGRERYLARSGIIPYNSALFKICENIIHGKTDVREIYHLYDNYYPQALPPGTELLGILGNHDERRALNTFGQRGLSAAVGLTTFMSGMILDYEGSAEGEGWKVFLDNIYVNWNQFEYASHRSVERFYQEVFDFHRNNRGRGYLVWANNNMVAAALKFDERVMTLGTFNFSNENQPVSIQFDNPSLPIADDGFYRIVDPLYSSVTRHYNYYSGRELRVSRLHTVVPYTDRVKLLRLEVISDPERNYPEFLRDSMFRMCAISDPRHFTSNFAFLQLADHVGSFEDFASFLRDRIGPLFDAQNLRFLELGLKRALYHMQRNGLKPGTELLDYVSRLCSEDDAQLRGLGESLRLHNERGPIVFISAEAEPFSKFGGLANVVYELPRELARLGEEVCVITPMYRYGDDKSVAKMKRAVKKYGVTYTDTNVNFMIHSTNYSVGVHFGEVDGVKYYLLDHHEFFDGLYWGYTSAEKLRRRVGFARACAEVISRFNLRPSYTFTNDAYSGVFNGIVRLDPYYAGNSAFKRNSFLHLIHNGGWQYFDSYHRWESGTDLFSNFNLPEPKAADFVDPVHGDKINCMAVGIRCADKIITVSPSYAKQLTVASDGLEHLLHEVTGINNAIGRDFLSQMQQRFDDSGFVDTVYPRLLEIVETDRKLRSTIEERFPDLLSGPRACENLSNVRKRDLQVRMRNKLLLQIQEGLDVDPDRVVFSMIHRIVEQKGFQLLLEASERVFRELGCQGVIAGPVSFGDQKAEEIARGLSLLGGYYPGKVSVHIGFHEISIPLLASDIFLMPSQYEPGGISQLEAFACGCLVVARATGGLRDTVFPMRTVGSGITGNGFLFTDFNPTAFFDAMSRAMAFFRDSDDDRILAARNNARESVGYWDASAARYIQEIYGLKEIIRPELAPLVFSGR